jgi:hypothetical protein
MKIDVKKTPFGWTPNNEKASKYHSKWNNGDIYSLEFSHYRDQRNKKLLEKYWKMLNLIVENHPSYREAEDLHHDIKWGLDLVEFRVDVRTGSSYKVVKSIAMDKMDQETFERFYSDAINFLLEFIVSGTSREELEYEIAVNFG